MSLSLSQSLTLVSSFFFFFIFLSFSIALLSFWKKKRFWGVCVFFALFSNARVCVCRRSDFFFFLRGKRANVSSRAAPLIIRILRTQTERQTEREREFHRVQIHPRVSLLSRSLDEKRRKKMSSSSSSSALLVAKKEKVFKARENRSREGVRAR